MRVKRKVKSKTFTIRLTEDEYNTLDAITYVNMPGNKDKIENEMKQYPCAKCIHHNDDKDSCIIGASFKCLRNPEKYWKAKED